MKVSKIGKVVGIVAFALVIVGCGGNSDSVGQGGSGSAGDSGSSFDGGTGGYGDENFGSEPVEPEPPIVSVDPMSQRDTIVIYRGWTMEGCNMVPEGNAPIIAAEESAGYGNLYIVLTRLESNSITCENYGKTENKIVENVGVECRVMETGMKEEGSCVIGYDYYAEGEGPNCYTKS